MTSKLIDPCSPQGWLLLLDQSSGLHDVVIRAMEFTSASFADYARRTVFRPGAEAFLHLQFPSGTAAGSVVRFWGVERLSVDLGLEREAQRTPDAGRFVFRFGPVEIDAQGAVAWMLGDRALGNDRTLRSLLPRTSYEFWMRGDPSYEPSST